MKARKSFVVVPLTLFLFAASLMAQTAYIRTSTNTNRWVDSGVREGTTWASISNYLEIFPNTQYQTIQGFGGCFCEIGWDAIQSLTSTAARDSVIRALFDTSGLNYTFCRLPIGANDFATSYYSLNDVSGDYQMTNFSLKRDSTKIIPFVRAAQAYKPNLRFWASPWTPPAWMKSSGTYNGGNMNSASTQTLTAYALYLSKAVQEFKKTGINIEYITCQNEPDQCSQNYPTCCWTNTQQINFYQNYMIPRFNTDNLTTKIIIGVYCCGNYSDWVTPFWNNATIAAKIGVVSHSWQTPAWGAQNWTEHPSTPFFETEADWGQNARHDWNIEAVNQFNSMVNFLTTGKAAVFTQWNMVLDERYASTWGFAQSAPISINRNTRVVTYEPHYWAIKHIEHYVKVGAKAINSTLSGGNPGQSAAFLNPNGDIILCASNVTAAPYAATIKVGNRMYKAIYPSNSFTTVRIASATTARPGIVRKNIGTAALTEARISNSVLYFTLSSAARTQDLTIAITDLRGRAIWTSPRDAGALQEDQQQWAIPLTRSTYCSGAYLLTIKIKNETGALTTTKMKIVSAD